MLEIHPLMKSMGVTQCHSLNDVSDFFAESDNSGIQWEQFLSLGGTIYNATAIYDTYLCLTVLTCSPSLSYYLFMKLFIIQSCPTLDDPMDR